MSRASHARVSLLLAAVASVSLVVGGIGIMNIMLVTVTERTREIGLRMAIGARQRDILTQFLVEAVTLAVLGGILGALVGITRATAIGTVAHWPVVIDLSAVLLAVSFAAFVDIVFGYFPARKAARLPPAEALRTEVKLAPARNAALCRLSFQTARTESHAIARDCVGRAIPTETISRSSSCSPAGCRPSRIASTISGASSVSRSTRLT